MQKKIVINSANLHTGGGVQVATSFINELSRSIVEDLSISVFASSEVSKNLKHLGTDISVFNEFKVIDVFGLHALRPSFSKNFSDFDLVFTVFGPDYFWSLDGIRLTGFAQAWIIYPKNEVYSSLPFWQKLRTRLKFNLQSWFFKQSSKFIVELEHVKQGLVERKIAKSEDIFVVHNCISSLYLTPEKWQSVTFELPLEKFSIGFIGRDYPHKNTTILAEIKKLLHAKHGLDVDFYVTLKNSEWAAKSDKFKACIKNVGELNIAQCPSFYQKMDAVIFPSLLESFSVTPLEAMVMEKPLFASDRDFVRDVCGDFVWYFDPNNAESAADLIALYIRKHAGRDKDQLRAAREHVVHFFSARQREINYINIIRKILDENRNSIRSRN